MHRPNEAILRVGILLRIGELMFLSTAQLEVRYAIVAHIGSRHR
jgi:hypothetical protein